MSADRLKQQATRAILITLILAFAGSLLGVVFGIAIGATSPPESFAIALCTVVVGGFLVFFSLRPEMATSVITAGLNVFFVCYLNLAAFLLTRQLPTLPGLFRIFRGSSRSS
ncbi:MAG: hypothetical protein ACEPO2_17700 [Pelagibaca sp.]